VARYAAGSFVSHLGAHLYYEQAQVRKDEHTQTYFAASAHMLWLEASHLYADSSYLEFCRGIINPIGIRLNTELTVEQVVEACQQLNPDREQGRLVLMSGITAPSEWLEELILAIKDARQPVLWLYDPLTSNDTSCVVNSAKNSRELKAVMTVHDKLESRLHGLFLPCANDSIKTHQNGTKESLPTLSFEQALQLCSHLVYSDLNRR
jgi:3-deoxy-7-phosphoheptulonate synthase